MIVINHWKKLPSNIKKQVPQQEYDSVFSRIKLPNLEALSMQGVVNATAKGVENVLYGSIYAIKGRQKADMLFERTPEDIEERKIKDKISSPIY